MIFVGLQMCVIYDLQSKYMSNNHNPLFSACPVGRFVFLHPQKSLSETCPAVLPKVSSSMDRKLPPRCDIITKQPGDDCCSLTQTHCACPLMRLRHQGDNRIRQIVRLDCQMPALPFAQTTLNTTNKKKEHPCRHNTDPTIKHQSG
jgi:hypothetical protein